MYRSLVILLIGFLAVGLLGTTAVRAVTIYPANGSFEDDHATTGSGMGPGVLEGGNYPSSWTFFCPQDNFNDYYGQFVDVVNDPVWHANGGYSVGGVSGNQYLFMYGYDVSPQLSQSLGNTIQAGKKYQLFADFAGMGIDSVTLTLSAGGPVTVPVLSIPNDYSSPVVTAPGSGTLIAETTVANLANQAFQPFSTELLLPPSALVGQSLTVTITPGHNPAGPDGNIGVGIDNIRIVEMPALMAGDADGDGVVNINDLSRVLTNYDRNGTQWADGDFNGDGTVNVADLSSVLTNYNLSSGLSGAKAVPEPSTLLLAVVGLVGLLARVGWRK